MAIAGDDLRLEGLPQRMQAGQPTGFQVCAEPQTDYTTGRVGLVEIHFGAPGAWGRVPVYWTPGETPQPPRTTIHLPLLVQESW